MVGSRRELGNLCEWEVPLKLKGLFNLISDQIDTAL